MRAKLFQTHLTLTLATAPLKTRAWAVSPDVLHRLGFHLVLRRRRTRGFFGVKQRFISIKSHRISQIGKLSSNKRNKEIHYFWMLLIVGTKARGKTRQYGMLDNLRQTPKPQRGKKDNLIQHCSFSKCVLRHECLDTSTTNLTLLSALPCTTQCFSLQSYRDWKQGPQKHTSCVKLFLRTTKCKNALECTLKMCAASTFLCLSDKFSLHLDCHL